MTTIRQIEKNTLWKLEPFKGKNGRWYFHWRSRNGKITVDGGQGNGYLTKWNAKRAAKSAVKHISATEQSWP